MQIITLMLFFQTSMVETRAPGKSTSLISNVVSATKLLTSRRQKTPAHPAPVVTPDVQKPSRLARVSDITSQSSLIVAGFGTLVNTITGWTNKVISY